jgi:hypothetical protein
VRGAHLKLPLRQHTLHAPTGIQGRLMLSCSRGLLVHLLLSLVLHDRSQVTVMITGKIASQWIRHQRAHGIPRVAPPAFTGSTRGSESPHLHYLSASW